MTKKPKTTDIVHSYKALFERAKALSKQLADTQDDLKQIRKDAEEELLAEVFNADAKKTIKAEIGEVFALAMIEAKNTNRKTAEKMDLRHRVAEMIGVQLSLAL